MTTKNNAIIEVLEKQILLCSEMIDSLILRYETSKITKEEYLEKISNWDNKQQDYAKQLQKLQSNE
jgi:hypothetical protein